MGISKKNKPADTYDISRDAALFGAMSNYSATEQESLRQGDTFVRVPKAELDRLRVGVHAFLL